MGLTICVGILPELRMSDPEGYEHHKVQLDRVSALLVRSGLPPHHESDGSEYWEADMYGYSGLHYLRRVAAYLALRGALPGPGDDDASEDPVLDEYYDIVARTGRGLRALLGKARRRQLGYDHMLLHSDAEGYYVPVEFDDVLFGNERRIAGGMVGSSQALLRECERLRAALAIPADSDPDAEELADAAARQGDGDGWRRYGVEALVCVRLHHAAKLSVAQGAAIVFA
jgi:hypothetical protein